MLLSFLFHFILFQSTIIRNTFQKRISEIFVVDFAAEMVNAIADC